MISVTAVIPALNEAESLGAVLAAIPGDLVAEVIVVDGGFARRHGGGRRGARRHGRDRASAEATAARVRPASG